MTEAEETAKALRGLGGRLRPANYRLGPIREWDIPLHNPAYPSGRMVVLQLKDKFTVGQLWKSYEEYRCLAIEKHLLMPGLELLEKIAEIYPEIAHRLARPMV
jgi:hypothetical protein